MQKQTKTEATIGVTMGAGRPTKYKEEYCEEIVKYFSVEPYREVIVTTEGKNFSKEDVKLVPNQLPFLSAFARHIGVTHDTLIEWTNVHPEFSEAYKKAKELQKEFLIENGLQGLYNPAFAIFTAKNITDMRDKQEIEHSGTISLAQQIASEYDGE